MRSQHSPFVYVAIFVLIGVGLAVFLNPYWSIGATGMLILASYFVNALKKWSLYLVVTLLTFVLSYISFHHNPFKNADQKVFKWKGVVIEKGQKFSKGMRYGVQVMGLSNHYEEQAVKGKILLFTRSEEPLRMGEIIEFQGKCNAVLEEDTAFWSRVNYRQGIQATVWANVIHKTGEVQPFYFYLGRAQNYLDEQVHTWVKTPSAAALATGILLGDKSYMDKTTKKEFIDSGAAHILAVSGLHVTILIVFLSFLLRWLPATPRYVVILVVLWFYGFITGLSPAVMRAVLMGSLAILAKLTKSNYFILNILCFSWVAQILLDPFGVYHLGLWLSYLAVLGIIFIQPHLVTKTKNWFMKWLQDNVSVGIAAQSATLPILIGFLGKFPVVFLVTNLITLPISVLATYAGFLLLFFAEVPVINQILGACCDYLFSWVLIANQWIANFSFSSIQFQPTLVGMFLAFVGLGGAVFYLNRKSLANQNSFSIL